MIASMTSFERMSQNLAGIFLEWELKSVNHRYLEMQVKLPDVLRFIEFPLRERMKHFMVRGKVELSVKLLYSGESATIKINERLAEKIIQLAESMRAKMKHAQELNPLELLRWPGVVQEESLLTEENSAQIMQFFDVFLTNFVAHRHREGSALEQIFRSKAAYISEVSLQMRALQPKVFESQRAKVWGLISSMAVQVDRDRFEQELGYMLKKADIIEELDRIDLHAHVIIRTLDQGGAVGRKLDFLAQECLREANTLSAKIADVSLAGHGINVKLAIEQFREQVQNVE